MSDLNQQSDISLREAIISWCDETTVNQLLKAETYFTAIELRGMGRYHFGAAQGLIAKGNVIDYSAAHKALKHAWENLLENFRRCIQLGQIYLRGAQTRPERQDLLSPIPNVWAQDFKFDFYKDEVTIGLKYRYIGVIASRFPPADKLPHPGGSNLAAATVTPEMVAALSDEMILALLEEYARRVVKNDAKLTVQAKISFVPIVRQKMRYRTSKAELKDTLQAEMSWLVAWLTERVPSHQVPTPKSLANALRNDYASCKAQSKGMMA
jgi:hypothetical protein